MTGGTSQSWNSTTPHYTGSNGEPNLNIYYSMSGYEVTISEVGGEVIMDIIMGWGNSGYTAMSESQALTGFGTTSWSNEAVIFKTGTAIGAINDAYNFSLTGTATMTPNYNLDMYNPNVFKI